MHEYHGAVEIIEDAIAEAKKKNQSKVSVIHLVIGEDSGFSGENIKMYFNDASKGTICEGADIVWTTTKTMLRCPKCHEMFVKKLFEYNCPHCGTEGEPTDAGREMAIDYLEF